MVLYLTIFKMQTRPRCSYDVMSIKLAIYFLLLPKGKMVTILFPQILLKRRIKVLRVRNNVSIKVLMLIPRKTLMWGNER